MASVTHSHARAAAVEPRAVQVQEQVQETVIEMVYGKQSGFLGKPETLLAAKLEAKKRWEQALQGVDVEDIEIRFRPSYLSSIIWDDAAWATLPHGSKVRVVKKKEKRIAVIRPVDVDIAPEPAPIAVTVEAGQPARVATTTAARQELRASQAPYRLPSQAPARPVSDATRGVRRAVSSVASSRSSASNRPAISDAYVRSSAPSPASIQGNAEAFSPPAPAASPPSQVQPSETITRRHEHVREDFVIPRVPTRHSVTTSARPAASTRVTLPSAPIREATSSRVRPVARHPSNGADDNLITGRARDGASVEVAGAPVEAAPAVAAPEASTVEVPAADDMALDFPSDFGPMMSVRLRDGVSYLQPGSQKALKINNLEPNFRFRTIREKLARKKGVIPGRIILSYKDVILQDSWTPCEVGMKNGAAIYYFFDEPRLRLSSTSFRMPAFLAQG